MKGGGEPSLCLLAGTSQSRPSTGFWVSSLPSRDLSFPICKMGGGRGTRRRPPLPLGSGGAEPRSTASALGTPGGGRDRRNRPPPPAPPPRAHRAAAPVHPTPCCSRRGAGRGVWLTWR